MTVGSIALVKRSFFNLGTQMSVSVPTTNRSTTSRRWGMVIDLKRCVGCQTCTRACNLAHNVPEGQEWIKVSKIQDNPDTGEYNFPRPCMNCQNAPCVKVCPVGATFYDEEGVVLIDNELCIGCRYCMAACPYGARYFNWGDPNQASDQAIAESTPEFANTHLKGVVEKCDFCAHLARDGTLPSCVAACPNSVLYYGDLAEDAVSNPNETISFSETLKRKHGYRFWEELGTEPRVYYLPPRRD